MGTHKSGTNKHLRSVHFANSITGWAVGFDGIVLATRDGGANWETQSTRTEKALLGVTFANAKIGWAVGADNIMLRAGRPISAPWADDTTVSSIGPGGGLSVSFLDHTELGPAVHEARVFARVGRGRGTLLGLQGNPTRATGGGILTGTLPRLESIRVTM